MAHKDPEKAKAYQRQYQKQRREDQKRQKKSPPSNPVLLKAVRIKTIADVIEQVNEQINAVNGCEDTGTAEKARTVAGLLRIALAAIEQGDMARRLEELEQMVKELGLGGTAA